VGLVYVDVSMPQQIDYEHLCIYPHLVEVLIDMVLNKNFNSLIN
jgi:hypothetical protein